MGLPPNIVVILPDMIAIPALSHIVASSLYDYLSLN